MNDTLPYTLLYEINIKSNLNLNIQTAETKRVFQASLLHTEYGAIKNRLKMINLLTI